MPSWCSPRWGPSSSGCSWKSARADRDARHRVRGPVPLGSRSCATSVGGAVGAAPAGGGTSATVGSVSGSWVTASREQYCCGRLVPELLERGARARRSSARARGQRRARAQRAVGGGEERVERDVLDQHRHGRAGCGGGRSRGAGGGRRARACAGRRRRTRARWRAGSACRSGGGGAGAPGGAARRRAATTASATPRSACIHGGVESSPHSHGWMRVTSAEPSSAARGTTSGGRRRASAASRRRTRRARRSGARAATRSTATATSGGWVMQVVATSRGASGVAGATARRGGCRRRGCPRRRSCAAASRWPTGRGAGRAARRPRAVASKRAMPMAVKHESHSHWCGIERTDGQV